MHIHIDSTDGTAKFWLEPIVALEVYYNMKSKELSEIEEIVKEKKLFYCWHNAIIKTQRESFRSFE